MDHQPQDQSPIESAGPYYEGWVQFTRWSKYGIIAIVALLAVMAATLV